MLMCQPYLQIDFLPIFFGRGVRGSKSTRNLVGLKRLNLGVNHLQVSEHVCSFPSEGIGSLLRFFFITYFKIFFFFFFFFCTLPCSRSLLK